MECGMPGANLRDELKGEQEEQDCRGQDVEERKGLLCNEVGIETEGCVGRRDGERICTTGYRSQTDDDEEDNRGPQKPAHDWGYEDEQAIVPRSARRIFSGA